MMKQDQNITISVIIVNYHVKKELLACIASIKATTPKVSYEVIVVDNDETKDLANDLLKQFPDVVYVPSSNKGYGQGNNVGVKKAKGKYLFFLNPDTQLLTNCLDLLTTFLNKHKDVGIVAPLLYDKKKNIFPLQGTRELTPLRALFSLSFISKLFPHNPVLKEYWMADWDITKHKEVSVVPGTAFVIRREIFKKLNGFDEKFFLFFEEFDLCKRVKEQWKIIMYPKAKVLHHWGASTKERKDIEKVFTESRFYYFRKNYGILPALCTEAILRFNKFMLFVALLAVLGTFLRLTDIDRTMTFIGDQGWFYLSARDLVLWKEFPLVGIASSHPWLHQGALWTYLLTGWFAIWGFNPLNGAYLATALDGIAILLFYKLGTEMFSRRLGMIAAALYATSPLAISFIRMPYHTSPIPLFTILFIFFLYKWVSGKVQYFPFVIGSLVMLYNLELATFVFTFIVSLIFFFGLWKKYLWATSLFQPKIILYSLLAFGISMLPMIMYDLFHGFPQTLGFLAWVGYKVLVVFGLPPLQPATPASWTTLFQFSGESYQKLIFPTNSLVATAIFFGSLGFFTESLRRIIFEKKIQVNLAVLALVVIIPLLGFFAVRTPSDAYLPMLFPGMLLLTALFIDGFFKYKRLKIVGMLSLFLICLFNIYFFVSHHYSLRNETDEFTKRMAIARQIVTEADGIEYNLKGTGLGSQFESFTMNYAYLTWWLGHGPSDHEQPVQFVISEDEKGIHIKKYD